MSFWDNCIEWPQLTLKTERSKVFHILYMLQPPMTSKFCCFPLRLAGFELQAILWQQTSVPNDPQIPVAKRSKVPYITCNNYPPSSKFQSISLYIAMIGFRVTGHFEKSALNDPKMTLNIKGQRYRLNRHQKIKTILPPTPRFHSILRPPSI